MEAKELRIGNWLKFDTFKDFCFVCRIKENGFSVRNAVTNKVFNYANGFTEPIPLTPGILEKAGFQKIDYDEFKHGNLVFQLAKYQKGYSVNVFISGELLGAYDYVHQLQNLYFALTREELTIKDL